MKLIKGRGKVVKNKAVKLGGWGFVASWGNADPSASVGMTICG